MIKNWNLFKESNLDEESKIVELCKKYRIENYTINSDGSIDVGGDVDLSYFKISNIPLKFGIIIGNFDCSSNNLTSLKGCPEFVGKGFYCQGNKITSLEYLPKRIGGFIDCNHNKIWSFGGIPDNYSHDEFYCYGNPIQNIWKLFESSKDIEFFNDCHIIREPENPSSLPIVVLERLNFFLETIGKPTVEKVDSYINI
jgi:hypothetical protein